MRKTAYLASSAAATRAVSSGSLTMRARPVKCTARSSAQRLPDSTKKDIIIRGGENISAAEIEELMLRMPGIAEVAVVAAPDERMGEHACAFVRLQPGGSVPGLPAVREHLNEAGLAKQKWPEEVRELDEFPRTPSGKIQKFVLRDRLRHSD